MKNLSLIIVLTFIYSLSLNAKIFTVSNIGGANFSNLTDAYNAAVDDDTIYIEATNINYGDLLNINKRLTWVGIGINPGTDDVHQSIIRRMSINTGASGSKFFGIYFFEYLSTDPATGPITNLLIESCHFRLYIDFGDVPVQNSTVRNCVFTRYSSNRFDDWRSIYFHNPDSVQNQSTINLTNCYFISSVNGANNPHNLLVFDHCIFAEERFQDVQGALITNSIFYYLYGSGSTPSSAFGGINNIFLNNIIRQNASLGLSNTGSGNMFNTDPLFVNDGNNNYLWSASEDYNLQPGSPGIGAATDSTDIGIHGGDSNFSNSGETLWIPIVRSSSFQGSVIPLVQPGDTIQLQIKASRPSID